MEGEQPFVQRNVRSLHDRAGANGELVAAIIAEEIDGLRLALEPSDAERAAMRAGRFTAPTRRFAMCLSGFFVVEDRVGDVDGHGGCFPLCGQ